MPRIMMKNSESIEKKFSGLLVQKNGFIPFCSYLEVNTMYPNILSKNH